MDARDQKEIRSTIAFLREQAEIFRAVWHIAPFSSSGEFHAQMALTQEANRLEEKLNAAAV